MPHFMFKRHIKTLAAILVVLLPFSLNAQQPLDSGSVLINEILFNPPPGGCDYVELYNRCDSAISTKHLRLARMVGDSIAKLYKIADDKTIQPHDYVVLTTDAAWVCGQYTVRFPDKIIEMSSLPSYNDASGCVALFTDDSILIDRLDYTEKMQSRLLRDVEGVALERRSFDVSTQEWSNWYSASSTSGYGTPTYTNSQSREILFIDNELTTTLTLFSPDGDGYNDLMDITWKLQDCSLSANISIFDAAGREVRRLGRAILMGCSGIVSWDGTDNDGQRCPRGNYLIVAETYNESGTKQSWRRRISLVRQ